MKNQKKEGGQVIGSRQLQQKVKQKEQKKRKISLTQKGVEDVGEIFS